MAVALQPHVVGLPKAFLGIRIVQLVFAVIIFGISIYGSLAGAIPGPALNLFTSLITIITVVYYLVGRYGQPAIYQYWAVLALDIFCMIFWLVAFAVLASEVALAASVECHTYTYYGYTYSTGCSSTVLGVIGVFGACAGLGAVEFVLFIATTSLFSVGLSRHRANGGHSTIGAATGGDPQKYEMSNQPVAHPTATAAVHNAPYQSYNAPAPQGAQYQANQSYNAPAPQGAQYQANQSYNDPAPHGAQYQANPGPGSDSTPLSSPSPVSALPHTHTQDPRYGGGPPVHNVQEYQQAPSPQYTPQQTHQYPHPTATEMPSMPTQDYAPQYKQPQATQLP